MTIMADDATRLRGQRTANLVLADLLEQEELPLVEWAIPPYQGTPTLTGTTWESSTEVISAWATRLGGDLVARQIGMLWHCTARGRIDGVDVRVLCVQQRKPEFRR